MMLSSRLVVMSSLVCFLFLLAAADKEGDIRLAGSTDKWQGRVELFHNKTWGTVCDDYWDINYAKVVCRQLGYTDALEIYAEADFGKGTGPIQVDRLYCIGNESKLLDCKHTGWNNNYCDHKEDVGVACAHQSAIPPGGCTFDQDLCGYTNAGDDDFDWIRQTHKTPSFDTGPAHDHTTGNGSYIYIETSYPRVQGEMARIVSPPFTGPRCVQFYYIMRGKTVNELSVYIDDGFQRKVIWQLKGEQKVWNKATFPVLNVGSVHIVFEALVGVSYQGDIAIDDVTALKTSACSLLPKTAKPEPIDFANISSTVRLVNGNVSSAGRIEVLHNGRWGTVCGTHFHLPAAEVVCRQLGYLDVETLVPCCLFKPGKGMIWLDNLHCEGREKSLTMCPHKGWGITACAHNRDVGVICKTNKTLKDIRLGGSDNDFEGRVEVKIGGTWGTIMDYGWDIFDSTVFCRQIGYGGATSAYSSAHYGPGKGPIWFSRVLCQGSESALWKCNMTQHKIQWNPNPWWHWNLHNRDASAECYDIRLTGGKNAMEGRVEVRYLGIWGTICNHGWDMKAATVACRNLGFSKVKSMKVSYSIKPIVNVDPVWTRFRCSGDESALGLCGYDVLRSVIHSCTHDTDVTLVCDAPFATPSPGPGPKYCDSKCTDTCYKNAKHGGVCICPKRGDSCDATVGYEVSEARFTNLTISNWDPEVFKSKLRDQLNIYCKSPKACTNVNNGSIFEVEDVVILNGWPQTFQGQLNLRFIVLAPTLYSRVIVPREVITAMASKQSNKLGGYDVFVTRKPIYPHAQARKGDSNIVTIVISIVVVLVVLIGAAVVVYIIYKRKSAFGAPGSGGSSSQRYLHLSPDDRGDQDDPLLTMEDDEAAPTSVRA